MNPELIETGKSAAKVSGVVFLVGLIAFPVYAFVRGAIGRSAGPVLAPTTYTEAKASPEFAKLKMSGPLQSGVYECRTL